MRKPQQNQVPSPEIESEAFEMIELAIDEVELLTRAFTLIDEVCQEREPQYIEFDGIPDKALIN